MAKYYKSDYARNKKSKSIIYHYSDGTEFELTMENYLAENPSLTEEDFLELKELSNEMYRNEMNSDNYHQKKKEKNAKEELLSILSPSQEETMIFEEEKEKIRIVTNQLLSTGKLTKTQERRFISFFIDGKSTRQIATEEGVSQYAVWDSLKWAKKKLEKLYAQ